MSSEEIIINYVLNQLDKYGKAENGIDVLCAELDMVRKIIKGSASYDTDKIVKAAFLEGNNA